MALPFTDYTSNVTTSDNFVVTGDGMFDDLMETINAHLSARFLAGQITGKEYAIVYLGAIQEAAQTSAKIFLEREISEKKSVLLDQQIAESAAKTSLLTAQELTEDKKTLLVIAQTLGFKIDAKQKLYAKTVETYAVHESVNKNSVVPTIIEDANITTLFNDLNELIEPGVADIS